MSSPACFKAMIARAVSRILPQLSECSLVFNSDTQSSKMLSGVARIVSASSWVVKVEQSRAFSSRHSKASSIFVESDSSSVVSLSAARTRENENSINNKVRNVMLFFIEGRGLGCL